jgi:hypothetical protein
VSIGAASPRATRARTARSRNSASATPSRATPRRRSPSYQRAYVLAASSRSLLTAAFWSASAAGLQRPRLDERVAPLVGDEPLPHRHREADLEDPRVDRRVERVAGAPVARDVAA